MKPRSPLRAKAFEMWLSSGKTAKLRDIARELNVPEKTVSAWKVKDKWDTPTESIDEQLYEAVEQNEELSEKQKLFCLLYVKTFNATSSHQKAFGSSYKTAMTEGCRMLGYTKIAKEIKRLKKMRSLSLMADVDDLVEFHMKIAFTDITDFVEFGQEQVHVMAMYGPVMVKDPDTGEKVPLMKDVNYVRFKDHTEVDGRIIKEIKQGKDGASVKMEDRQKSLDFLERWFTANPMDRHKIAHDKARLEIERTRSATPDGGSSLADAIQDAYRIREEGGDDDA